MTCGADFCHEKLSRSGYLFPSVLKVCHVKPILVLHKLKLKTFHWSFSFISCPEAPDQNSYHHQPWPELLQSQEENTRRRRWGRKLSFLLKINFYHFLGEGLKKPKSAYATPENENFQKKIFQIFFLIFFPPKTIETS